MKDEIKEILDNLAFTNDNYMWCDKTTLDTKKSHLLLDYITNLQEENNKLKGAIETIKETNKLLIQQKAQLQDDLDMLDNRIDKAIEYITTEQLYTNYQWGKSQYVKILKDLLNILQGKSDE